MERGSLYWVNLSDSRPPEMGKVRPAIIVSNSGDNLRLSSVVVVPLSSRPPAAWPFRVEVDGIGTKKQSYAIVPGVRQVAKRRLEKRMGKLTDEDLKNVSEALDLHLSN